MTYWLSYGGGVNSTALAVLIVQGKLPQYQPVRFVFSDTGEEKPETYAYIENHFAPYLEKHGYQLEIVRPKESVLEHWERLKVTGSRLIRACTVEGKIQPINKHVKDNGGGIHLIGIDAGEAHRMPDHVRPLVDLDIDRDGCEKIILAAGLPSPGKSGCWCCPFLRVQDIITLIRTQPCKANRIKLLEQTATETHGTDPHGNPRTQFSDHPIEFWEKRASQGDFFQPSIIATETPCGCYDG